MNFGQNAYQGITTAPLTIMNFSIVSFFFEGRDKRREEEGKNDTFSSRHVPKQICTASLSYMSSPMRNTLNNKLLTSSNAINIR